jgi:hypothetical protein
LLAITDNISFNAPDLSFINYYGSGFILSRYLFRTASISFETSGKAAAIPCSKYPVDLIVPGPPVKR